MRAIPLGLAGLCLAGPALAQLPEQPFPMDPVRVDGTLDALVLEPRPVDIASLTGLSDVHLVDVLLPDGQLVDLTLERISVERHRFRHHVNGVEAPWLGQDLDLSVWKGVVDGLPNTSVMLGFSTHGCRGWIHLGTDVVHLMPQPDEAGSWSSGFAYLVTESALNQRGMELEFGCAAETMPVVPDAAPVNPALGGAAPPVVTQNPVGSCSLVECPIALETDTQYFAIFNDLNAATAYTTTLWTFVADRYETQASTVLTFPYVNYYTGGTDPWAAQDDSSNNCGDVLTELQQTWVGNVPNGARIGMLVSGANLGCGVAWLGVLCNNEFNFAVTGNMNGNLNFPVVQQPNNWDFIVCAHELGHNFNAPHTHDYCPPLDECPDQQYWGSCQTQTVCSNQGTIMSYCHLCSGGTANITTYFHPQTSADMTAHAAACLQPYSGAEADSPAILTPGLATPVTLTTVSTPSGGVDLMWDNGGGYVAIPMSDQGGGVWAADLPAAACGDSPSYYYTFTDLACGTVTVPSGAPASHFTANVGIQTMLVDDDLEAPSGWSVGDPGDDATTGIWELVDPNGTAAQPGSDHSPAGTQCWVTGQGSPGGGLGENDVDGGTTTLYSPVYDLSGETNPLVSYWRWYSNDTGGAPNADTFEIEVTDDGSTWTTVESVGPNGPGGWVQHSFYVSDLVDLTNLVQLRFVASDLGTGSVVEAAIDDLTIDDLACDQGLGDNYCGPAAVNSTGLAGEMSASGSYVAANNDLTLTAEGLPDGQFAYFLASQVVDFVPNPGGSQGDICLGNPIARFNAQVGQVAGGEFSIVVDLTSIPTTPVSSVMSGETWYFQCWYRDLNPGTTSNFTDGLQITFL